MWIVEIKYNYCGLKTYMLTRLPSLTHSVYLYYRKWRKGIRWMNHQVVLFTSLYMYIFVEWLVMLSFMLYDLYRNMTSRLLIMKWNYISLWNVLIKDLFYHVLFLGTNSASLLKSNGFTLKMFKKHKWNRSFMAEILGMSHSRPTTTITYTYHASI